MSVSTKPLSSSSTVRPALPLALRNSKYFSKNALAAGTSGTIR
jgi:hypothetical protein